MVNPFSFRKTSPPAPTSAESSPAREGDQLTNATTAQPASLKTLSTHTPNSAESVPFWTVTERESFRRQIAGFSGLHELARENAAILEEVRQLIPEHGDSSFARTQVGGNSLVCQESLKELDNLVKMATVLQELAVSLADVFQLNYLRALVAKEIAPEGSDL